MDILATSSKDTLLAYQQSCMPEIIKLAQPLFKSIQASYFCQVRVFHNGKFKSLMTDVKPANYFHQNQYPITYSNGKEIILNNGVYIQSQVEGLKAINDKNILHEIFNLDHFIYLVEKNQGFDDLYIFAAKPSDQGYTNLLINNLDIVKHFLHYFKYETRHLLNNCPNILYDRTCFKPSAPAFCKPKDTYKNMPLKKVFLTVAEKSVTVSAQEFKCLKLISKNYTLKEVAKIMSLSPRTIETYLNSLKYKLKCHSKSQLVDYLDSIYLL